MINNKPCYKEVTYDAIISDFNTGMHTEWKTGYTVVVYDSGLRKYFSYGKLHRRYGPALEDPGKYAEWHLHGRRVTDNESYRLTAGLTKEEMTALVLKYGCVT